VAVGPADHPHVLADEDYTGPAAAGNCSATHAVAAWFAGGPAMTAGLPVALITPATIAVLDPLAKTVCDRPPVLRPPRRLSRKDPALFGRPSWPAADRVQSGAAPGRSARHLAAAAEGPLPPAGHDRVQSRAPMVTPENRRRQFVFRTAEH
jgi:hypothetical protein